MERTISNLSAWCIVVGAGSGSRMGAQRPKQFLRLGRRSVLSHTLAVVCGVELIQGVVAVVPRNRLADVRRMVRRDPALSKVAYIVAGGAERADSVLAGLDALDGQCDVVAIHDAARPLVLPSQFAKTIRVAARFGAAVLAVPVCDTIKQATDEGVVLQTPDRRRLWAAQTPQAFERNLLLDAYRAAHDDGFSATDDAALVERINGRVVLVPGSPENFKITTLHDLQHARLVLAQRRGAAR
ncbi:MAG: 2-C-methyl-D-erythritol 4-phosphate cytidylyltransferase [Candidatus Alcyoniella australis]|nr:2-C-methyl-D-erythritol 4-phosphate cytidylyltransferase [Candidatus Alcyoniella australis]